ncbi:putative nucleic-acid binding protein [Arracacha virus V]|uniref:Putative nucleic-acid binding protein n=1 Tax=Arracacha virus V TaxID=1972716 RepID=A0A1V0JB96_9VIRU|nr:putative nucleic-acid binding protein [Arracacha virus V]ARD06102.1 putative nucleic-acid binding protein [Arracacha virus V]
MGEPFLGNSKSSAKRRARRHDRCLKCGAISHLSKCKQLPSASQMECQSYLVSGPNRFKTERPHWSNVDWLCLRDAQAAGVEYHREWLLNKHSGNGLKIKSPEETPEYYNY